MKNNMLNDYGRLIMKKSCLDLGRVLTLPIGVKIMLAYERGYPESEDKKVCISPRRNYPLSFKPGTDVQLVVYDRKSSLYVVEPLTFQESGTAKIAPILDKYEIERTPVSTEEWSFFRKYGQHKNDITLCNNGFYTVTRTWLDCDVWDVASYLKDGIKVGDRTLKTLLYSQAFIEIEAGCYEFIEKMLSDGCSEEEYKKFKGEYIHPSSTDEVSEIFE